MSRLLSETPAGKSRQPAGAGKWLIGGVEYDSAAVKFWSGLLDEVAEDFPDADGLGLEAPCDNLLHPRLLGFEIKETPGEDMEDDGLAALFQAVATELEMTGPPLPVRAEVLAGDRKLASLALPDDVINAELLPHFLVWPLEWSRLSEFGWNRREVEGGFMALDLGRGWIYSVRVHLDNRHVHEGLFQRRMTVRCERRKAPAPSSVKA